MSKFSPARFIHHIETEELTAREAHIASIAKWYAMTYYSNCFEYFMHSPADSCGLCEYSRKNSTIKGFCNTCPVPEETGVLGCGDTPYETVVKLHGLYVENTDIIHAACLAELAFLSRLYVNEYGEVPWPEVIAFLANSIVSTNCGTCKHSKSVNTDHCHTSKCFQVLVEYPSWEPIQ